MEGAAVAVASRRAPCPGAPGRRQRADRLDGRVADCGFLMLAPLSGRPCLACAIAARERSLSGDEPARWILHETRGVPFDVGGVTVDGAAVILDLPFRMIGLGELLRSGVDLYGFLQKRDLFASEGDLDLFEATLLVGDEVGVVRRPQHEGRPVVTLSSPHSTASATRGGSPSSPVRGRGHFGGRDRARSVPRPIQELRSSSAS